MKADMTDTLHVRVRAPGKLEQPISDVIDYILQELVENTRLSESQIENTTTATNDTLTIEVQVHEDHTTSVISFLERHDDVERVSRTQYTT